MAVLKCKMCGDDIIANEDRTYGQCESCGSVSTLPKIPDEQLANLYNRANYIRRQNDFDGALDIYQRIINEDNSQAEAHWCAVLCKYGIEYVVDPTTQKRVPTCHRASFDDVLKDIDYLETLKYTTETYTKELYQQEAQYISKVQKEIIGISQKAEPYDIFICYKESDPTGQRTADSVMAQEMYYQLTEKGYKVFFARITLEKVVGKAYEPYIFSALNSAKVMLVIGTQKDYVNGTWVKNEWSRYLALMKQDRSRLLIPCYKGMNPYDLPEEMSILQAQDMNKIGAMQDLLYGIDKVLIKPVAQVNVTVTADTSEQMAQVEPLYKRGVIFLADGKFTQAYDYFNRVLDLDPEYAPAYIGLLCVELKCREDNLIDQDSNIWEHSNYKKALKYATDEYERTVQGYQQRAKEVRYEKAMKLLEKGASVAVRQAEKLLQTIPDYSQSKAGLEECKRLLKELEYQSAMKLFHANTHESLTQGAKEFKALGAYKDAPEQEQACRDGILELKYLEAKGYGEKNDPAEVRRAMYMLQALGNYKDCERLVEQYRTKRTELEKTVKIVEQKNNLRNFVLGGVVAIAWVYFMITFLEF